MHAQRVSEEEGEERGEEASQQGDDSDANWGGSQYVSDDEFETFDCNEYMDNEIQNEEVELEAGPSRLGAMRIVQMNAMRNISIKVDAPAMRIAATRRIDTHSENKRGISNFQPKRDPKRQGTLAAEVLINGVKAYTLFNSGSTTDSITPEFAHVTKAPKITLEEQVTLQLGCVGSRSKICYGMLVPITLGRINKKAYFDVVNLDRYDCIIGTPFMSEHKISLDFGRKVIIIGDMEIAALTYSEDAAVAATKVSRASIHRQRDKPTQKENARVASRGGETKKEKDE